MLFIYHRKYIVRLLCVFEGRDVLVVRVRGNQQVVALAQLLFGLIFLSLVGVELCLHLCLCCSSIPVKLLVGGAERLALSDVCSF